MSNYEGFIKDVRLPKMVRIRQRFDHPFIENIDKEIKDQISNLRLLDNIKPGANIAIGVGSRGINNLPEIVKSTIDVLKEAGANPFIIPTMGSHGGATAEGQVELLSSLGVTEESMGVTIKSSMDVVQIGCTEDDIPVYFDKNAYEADGSVIIARIKPHPGFRGKYESGFLKMAVIGFGKQVGAEACHSPGMNEFANNLVKTGEIALEHGNILFGIGIIENANNKTAQISAVSRENILAAEPNLLDKAKQYIPHIPFDKIDLLIVDEMGKNISGPGMDTHIIRRFTNPYISAEPLAKTIAVLDLTDETNGNATGVGLADVITKRLFDKVVFDKTYPNLITSKVLFSAKIPMVMETDELCIKIAIKSATSVNYQNPRIVRIKNTKEMESIWISENLLDEIINNPVVELLTKPEYFNFDNEGNFTDI